MNFEDILHHQKRRRVWPSVVFSIAAIFLIIAGGTLFYLRSLGPGELLRSAYVRGQIQGDIGEGDQELFELLLYALGFGGERTYLVLFQDNMRLRPGGGFIDSYAVVTVRRGEVVVRHVEGAEFLDERAPKDWNPPPPAPLVQINGEDRWQFRDSNWSPYFTENAKRALNFYRALGGASAKDIDMVLAVTPTVFEKWLSFSGPVRAGHVTVGSDDVAATLAYDAQIGYRERGLTDRERTDLLETFLRALVSQSEDVIRERYPEFLNTMLSLVREQQLMVYAVNPSVQERFIRREFSGAYAPASDDYLLWADANMGLKRGDIAITRALHYAVVPEPGGRFIAVAVMNYMHSGQEDWQAGAYDTLARVFVPRASELLSVVVSGEGGDVNTADDVIRGFEEDAVWFGVPISILPGKQKTVQFIYLLPEHISGRAGEGAYALHVEKQAGVLPYQLTTDLDFGRTVTAAVPAEPEEEWGNARYGRQFLLTDRADITVSLGQ